MMWIAGSDMRSIFKYLLNIPVFLVAYCISASAQEVEHSRHELGIDVANALTFIKRNTQSYLLNYRYNHNDKLGLRAGLNLDVGDGNSEGIYPDVRVGIQKNRREGHWNIYFGSDISFSYFKSNAVSTRTTRWGVSPMLGVQYLIHRRLSLSTEASLNFNFYKIRTPGSFDPSANDDYYRIYIGSVGMVLISYHFN
jgi:hypothetical protein